MPHIQKFLAGEGLYAKGVIHEKFFIADLCTKGCLGYTRAKTEDLKKNLFCFCTQKGGYKRGGGVIHERLYMRHYSNAYR